MNHEIFWVAVDYDLAVMPNRKSHSRFLSILFYFVQQIKPSVFYVFVNDHFHNLFLRNSTIYIIFWQTKNPLLKRGFGPNLSRSFVFGSTTLFSDNKENILLYREILHKFIIKEKPSIARVFL